MFHLINTAYAESAAAGTAGGGLSSSLLMIIVMVVVFYFLLIRPENKRKKEAESMRSSLKKGDYITTIGGVYGRVVAVTDRTVVIETSEDRVRVEFVKSAVGQVGTLDEQAAAQQRLLHRQADVDPQRPARKAKKEKKSAEDTVAEKIEAADVKDDSAAE